MTHPRQRESLQELAEKSKQRIRAMPQVAHTNQLDEVIPQRLCRIKRSVLIFEVYKPHDTKAKPTDKSCRQMQR